MQTVLIKSEGHKTNKKDMNVEMDQQEGGDEGKRKKREHGTSAVYMHGTLYTCVEHCICMEHGAHVWSTVHMYGTVHVYEIAKEQIDSIFLKKMILNYTFWLHHAFVNGYKNVKCIINF